MPKIRLVDAEQFKAADEKDGLALVKTCAQSVVRAGDREAKAAGASNADRVLRFIISTDDVDRDGDTVSVSGWKLAEYRKNPVVLWAHDYSAPPIARSLTTRKEDGKLVSLAEFQPADLNPFADMVFRMFAGGWMRATSVGFIPHEWKAPEDTATRPYGWDVTSQTLIEFSAVPVPSNPAALIDAHKAGVNTAPLKAWAEKVLDLGEPLRGLAREDIEKAWDAMSTRAIYIDLKSDDDAEEPAAVPAPVADAVTPPDPAPAIDDTPEEAPESPLAASTCPECAEPLSLALPMDGAETVIHCACGAGWTVKSADVIDLADFDADEPETFEIEESALPAFDADAVEAAALRMAASLREKLSL